MHATSVPVLNRILTRQRSSLLQYLQGAWPWASSATSEPLERLQKLMQEEEAACRHLADVLLRHRCQPASVNFHQGFSSSHYVALDHLLPWLVSYQQWLISQLEKDLGELTADSVALEAGRQLLEMNRRHLAELKALAKEYSGPKAASTVR